MKPFVFQQFEILQHKNVFRVGTDGVILGALVNIGTSKTVLEVGTGTGLISLMLAQRNLQADILALDINEDAAALASQNFSKAPFSDRLKVIQCNYKNFTSEDLFDFIISNPPYFEKSNSNKDKIARQTVELNFEELISKSSELLNDDGVFAVIIPYEAGASFIKICKKYQLYLRRQVNVIGIISSSPKRLVLEFHRRQSSVLEENFVIEKSPRQYSDQYLELTKEFHVFNKK